MLAAVSVSTADRRASDICAEAKVVVAVNRTLMGNNRCTSLLFVLVSFCTLLRSVFNSRQMRKDLRVIRGRALWMGH